MSFRDFFHKYKVLTFVLYALCAAMAICFIDSWLINLLIVLPMLVLGAFILIEIFPRKGIDYMTVVCADGLGTVQITSRAIVKSICAATNAIDGVKYVSSTMVNDKVGLNLKLKIRIAYSKVIEISEVTRVFVKKVLEKEMNIRVSKIDVIVDSFVHEYKVNKVESTLTTEERIEAQETGKGNAPAYKLKYGEKETMYIVPSENEIKTMEQRPVDAGSDDTLSPEQVEDVSERQAEKLVPASTMAQISNPPSALRPSPSASASISKPQTPIPPSAPRPEASTPASISKPQVSKPRAADLHEDVEEIALPNTAPPRTRAEQMQQQREEAARKYAELKAKQEQRKSERK